MWRFCPLEVLLVLLAARHSAAEVESACYGPGSIAASVIISVIATALLFYILYQVWRRYWLKRKGKHLVLETDPERGVKKDQYAYDNAGFKESSPPHPDNHPDKNAKLDSIKSKWSQWSPLDALIAKNDKRKVLDDSVSQPEEVKSVLLKSHDFTGLGFSIHGNMRDGIFIKDVLHRGPAFESGKLNPGDRIKTVTINFEHVVYEDALTILSYASPYEVIIEARCSLKSRSTPNSQSTMKAASLGHPLYRSSSTADLMQMQKTVKKRLFQTGNGNSTLSSPYSSLQKTKANADVSISIEGSQSTSPSQLLLKTAASPDAKTNLEQKLLHNHQQQLKAKAESSAGEVESPPPMKTENKYQKLGIKVLPALDLKIERESEKVKDWPSPKSSELLQNDNNINLERHLDIIKVESTRTNLEETNEVERKPAAPLPPLAKKKPEDDDEIEVDGGFERHTSGSGIRRDKNGIPQELPSHMMNAAVAARRNRKGYNESSAREDPKSPKRQKGRAPAPPDEKTKNGGEDLTLTMASCDSDKVAKTLTTSKLMSKEGLYDGSDSEVETDNQSSVNTIELNANDITVHQSEDMEEMQNRRTASTGDLTKIQKVRKTSTGTLERAKSLDITDSGVVLTPAASKTRKSGSMKDNLECDLSEEEVGVLKEPRLSLALEELDTFQKSRLKKSTEWGNLEDAIINLDETDSKFTSCVPVNEPKPVIENSVDQIHITVRDSEQKHRAEVAPAKINVTPPESYINISDEEATNSFTYHATPSEVHLLIAVTNNFLTAERQSCALDPYYDPSSKTYSSNISITSLETGNNSNVSSIVCNFENIPIDVDMPFIQDEKLPPLEGDELYITALDTTVVSTEPNVSVSIPEVAANKTLTSFETSSSSSSTIIVPNDKPERSDDISEKSSSKSNYSLTYITEIQVLTPEKSNEQLEVGLSDQDKSKYCSSAELRMQSPDSGRSNSSSSIQSEKMDLQKELHKIKELAEEQLKKLPEMRFSTSSYESSRSSENSSSQIEILRSNFEKSPSKTSIKSDTGSLTRSRIPVATSKTPPTSPERRDSRNFDMEVDKDIIAVMSSPIHSTPLATSAKYQQKSVTKNVSVTSIRSTSKIPSGLSSRPPVPPRKYENSEGEVIIRSSNNGGIDSFKQWVFSPSGDNVVEMPMFRSEHK